MSTLRSIQPAEATGSMGTLFDGLQQKLGMFSNLASEIVEIIAVTAVNIFTNYFNHIAGTEIDFPVAAHASRAAHSR